MKITVLLSAIIVLGSGFSQISLGDNLDSTQGTGVMGTDTMEDGVIMDDELDPTAPGQVGGEQSVPSSEQGTTGDTVIPDNDVEDQIQNYLEETTPSIADDVNVRVRDDRIFLRGTVRTATEYQLAQEAAEQFAGGREVVNNLRVGPESGRITTP